MQEYANAFRRTGSGTLSKRTVGLDKKAGASGIAKNPGSPRFFIAPTALHVYGRLICSPIFIISRLILLSEIFA